MKFMIKKMAITLIILACILLIIGFILSLKSIKPMNLNLIAGLVILIGTFFGLFGKQLQDKNSSEKSDKILNTGVSTEDKVDYLKVQNSELATKTEELKEKAEKQATIIDNLRQENTDLYSKLANANKEIYNNLTGGNSYCIMEIGNINSTNDTGDLIFSVEGKNPLNRIQVRIVDIDEFQNQPMTLADITKNVLNIGTLDPGLAWSNNSKIRLNKANGVNLNIFFTANNGSTNQLIRMKFKNNKWTSAIKITNFEGDKELYLKIDPDYPILDIKKIF